ncbi:MAG TPA: DUF2520 domain-containing protein [Bacteroidales bacterium]|jgi:predicted short-subunit dehydrogenase-like oxidoreductase (DUF2520 family)|nr:DUF2520 domain-containing protein [Bacteroidales bacterium]HOL98358.1 DUF2520 domain-containing protein [Bacteroidales bacterium]HOM36797.1 DUF2520 domain-containing protein [Bacteroidales bacterium]HPD24643.1 DUF2520 domain-containing protein [Bacteroidales bacterium]HRS99527.1 DUF2520 domain-containing protein [Bacteroidales bacterium]
MINSIVILGTGNVAFHLGKFLHTCNIKILQIFGRNVIDGENLGKILNSYFINDISQISDKADLYIFAMTDTANYDIAVKANNLKGKFLVHTSGSLESSIFKNITDRYGVLYPFQTFTKNIEILDYQKIPFCIESSDKKSLNELKDLIERLGCKFYEMDYERRKKLHLSGVFASNFMNHCVYLAEKILKNSEIDKEIMSSLLKQSFYKILKNGAYQSQTGPAIRNDEIIMNKHLKLLENNPIEKEIYKKLSESIIANYKISKKNES